jgi:aminopeptidase N
VPRHDDFRNRAAMVVLLCLAGCYPAPTASPPLASPSPTSPASQSPATTGPASPGSAVDLGLGEPLDPTLGNPGYDVGHYEIDLAFDPERSWLEATVTLSATATEAMASVNVDFIGFVVDEVTVNGKAAAFARTGRDMTIRPTSPIASGAQFELAVRYRGTPQPFKSASGAPGGSLGWNIRSGTSYVVAEPDGARSWFPCNDVPWDKATYTFRLTVPASTTAAANGVLEDKVVDDGHTTWVWQMNQPMATYLATVVIGDYDIVDDPASSEVAGVPVRNLLPAGLSHVPSTPDGLEGQMVAFMAGYLGTFPFDAYGIAYIPQLAIGGGLECQTLSVVDATWERYLAHELAHQWLGDYVTPAHWRDIWLNEGFATYVEWLWMDHRGLMTLDEYAATASEDPYLLPPGDPWVHDMFNYSVYSRGALTLHALRARVGDMAFFTILRTWVERYGGRSATTSDFIALAEEISGADLTQFFQDWLYAQFMPELPK